MVHIVSITDCGEVETMGFAKFQNLFDYQQITRQ